MQQNNLKKPKNIKSKKRVGRGGKRGTYSGRGMKGQKSRAGHRIRPQIRDFIFETPKMKGPTNKGGKSSGKNQALISIVNLGSINKIAKGGDVINIKFLISNRLVRRNNGKNPKVKLLAKGELTKKVSVQGLEVSQAAIKKINDAGGTIQVINKEKKKTQTKTSK